MRMAIILTVMLGLGACEREQVAESNQSAIMDRAKALEKAADASVDESIAEITRESLEQSSVNEVAVQ